MRILSLALRLGLYVLASACSAAAAPIDVPSGGNLQQAITNAQPGDTIELAPGATFTGNFTLPAKNADAVTNDPDRW